jgi:integrase
MANIQERRNKNGELISFSIRVHRGRDSQGKQLKPFSTTFEVPEGWTETKARKEAAKQAIIFEKQCKEGTAPDSKQTFGVYAEYVIALKERSGVKHSTIKRYKSLLVRVNQGIGHIKIGDIRPQHLNKLYEELAADKINLKTGGKLSNKTIMEHHRFISTVMTQAEKEMLIPYNPAHKATPPKLKRTEANHFQIDEVERITKCLESEPLKWRTMTTLLMLTGCRRGELLGLKWSSVDFKNHQIKIENNLLYSAERGIYEETTKTGKTRMVKLPQEAITLLSQYKAWYEKQRKLNGDRWQSGEKWKNSNFVFVQETGEPMHPDSLTDWLDKFSTRHELPHINPHAFRHTFASILISKGIDIVTVSKTLGHEKVSTTTDIYAELMKQASEEASECIADVILRKAKQEEDPKVIQLQRRKVIKTRIADTASRKAK